MELDCTVCWFKHLSSANVLVIAQIMFSISLLGVGLPYMGVAVPERPGREIPPVLFIGLTTVQDSMSRSYI